MTRRADSLSKCYSELDSAGVPCNNQHEVKIEPIDWPLETSWYYLWSLGFQCYEPEPNAEFIVQFGNGTNVPTGEMRSVDLFLSQSIGGKKQLFNRSSIGFSLPSILVSLEFPITYELVSLYMRPDDLAVSFCSRACVLHFSPTNPKALSTGAIVGIACAGAVVIAGFIFLIVWLFRRQKASYRSI